MSLALQAVNKGAPAAIQYGVPKSTLGDRVSGRVLPGKNSGPPTYLNSLEEKELVQFLLRCCEIGYAKSRKQEKVSVGFGKEGNGTKGNLCVSNQRLVGVFLWEASQPHSTCASTTLQG